MHIAFGQLGDVAFGQQLKNFSKMLYTTVLEWRLFINDRSMIYQSLNQSYVIDEDEKMTFFNRN